MPPSQAINPKTKAKAPAWVRPFLILFLASVVTATGIFYFAEKIPLESLLSHVGFLKIKEVNITSEWPLTPSQVRGWMPPLEGRNIFLLRPENLIRSLSERPWVDSVTVRKQYPDRIVLEVATKRARALALIQNQSHWLDGQGRIIEKATPDLLRSLELPLVTRTTNSAEWEWRFAIQVLDVLSSQIAGTAEISQVFLGSYPLFKVYLSSPRVEVLFSAENWETQVPLLVPLLKNPPAQIGQPRKISLVFPKKAVVSPSLSH